MGHNKRKYNLKYRFIKYSITIIKLHHILYNIYNNNNQYYYNCVG